ncbi:lactosylceramide 4-alpha-galactosyltransferase-like [Vespa mandarinia]|uniref:lactosylceramide 4-alpha-galactosyltransferase-like n=1 Tax=Vespa mandarinia TaxID=7446 RepID=UPI0016201D78|nr:lactosylceramide 4-alpha-galactosyltransferase-like [Vespa mandarinia]XP_035733682.1 lactosylceramide 4-alpha-galactosyltransferase-like [Vespa mandarinia]XP_035733683.1 lactosylceramide 4-alpha-galactosyltransferase-like [Vespa mandarinia]
MKKRLFFGFVCAVLLFIVMTSNDNTIVQKVTNFIITDSNDVSCYEISTTYGFPHLESDSVKPILGKNIFFHETSCFDEKGIFLNPRQACAVESAALMNPESTIYLLFLSPSPISLETKEIIKQLSSYPNIKIRRIFPETYTKDTPLEDWYKSGTLMKSKWRRSHMSDILRYLTLWKYGGIYLDLDVVVTTSLENLTNFAGAEDWDDVAAGVLGFSSNKLGRRMADACLRDLKKNFRGNDWGNNGPGVITRILQKICSTKYTRDMSVSRCHGFKVFSPSAFYPIHYKKWTKYFEEKNINSTMEILKQARVIHVWNKLSKSKKIHVNSNVPYVVIARKYCPKVFSNCGNTF